MSTTVDRYTRRTYTSVPAAMQDALALHRELVHEIDHPAGLFLEADRLQFLARRVERLLVAAVRAVDGTSR